ncbi:MAG: dephospho-CoA kinase [Bacteroidales bacterium]|nr:dephospho-CoA kinase [Bacteroidales bacterium]MBR6847433.1 dephospho-CoA kinase [Bacteroidales bacterium]
MRVAITGNIGSGKSYVCDLFKSLGVPVFDSDREAKLLYDLPEVRQKMVERFGANIYNEEGALDRRLMASKVFADACALGYVESVLYPVLNKRFTDWADQQGTPYVLYESALIFEKHLEEMFDAIIVVAASESVRIRRVMTRDRCTEEQVRARMAMQLPQSEKVTKADFVIAHEDDDEDEYLMEQVGKIHAILFNRLNNLFLDF